MKIVKKKIEFRSKNIVQDLYFEKFESYKDFYDVLMKRQPDAYEKLEDILFDGGSSWVGVNSVEQAKDMFLNGWEQNVEKMKVAFKKELNTLEHNRKPKMFNNVAGFMPVVPNALRGLPNSMIDTRMEPKKSKILNFMVSISRAACNSVDEIIRKMSKIFAYVAMLERSGQYRCRITCFGKASAPNDRKKVLAAFSILIKNENQLFDIKRLCFPVIHPAMLRLFSFGWAKSLPLNRADYLESGYGAAFERWLNQDKQDFINQITDGNEKTIVVDLDTDIEEMLGKEVIQ